MRIRLLASLRLASLGTLASLILALADPVPLAAAAADRALGEAFLAHARCSGTHRFTLSPNGRIMLEIGYRNGKPTARAHDLEAGATRDLSGRVAYGFQWVGEDLLLYTAAPVGERRLLNPLSGQVRSLDGVAGLEDEVLFGTANSRHLGRRILFSTLSKGSRPARLVTVDIDAMSIVKDWGARPLGTLDLHQNRNGVPLMRRTMGPVAGNRLAREVLQSWRGTGWQDLLTFQSGRNGYRFYAGLDTDPQAEGAAIHMLTNLGRDRYELVRIDLASGSTSTALRSEAGDLHWVFFTDDGSTPLFGVSHDGLPLYHPLSDAGRRLIALASVAAPGYLRVMSANRPDGRAIVRRTTLSGGNEHLLVDLAQGSVRVLDHCPFAGVNAAITAERVHIASDEGHRLEGVLVGPKGALGALPLLVRPLPDTREVDPFWSDAGKIAFFASRGFRVLTINYRGSLGSGSAFRELGYLNFERAYEDLRLAVRWAIDRGHAAPDQVFLTGAKVGAQLAVAVLARDEGLVAGAIAEDLQPDLTPILQAERGRSWPFEGFVRRDPDSAGEDAPDPAAYVRRHSPLSFAEDIGGPLLLLHDTTNTFVPVEEIDALDRAIIGSGGQSQLWRFEASDKARYVDARAAFLLATLAFLERHLD